MKIRLAVLGCGNMGSAIALGLAKKLREKKSRKFSFVTYTPTHWRALRLARAVGGRAVRRVAELKNCDWFLITCKPQQFGNLAAELRKTVGKNSKIISVAAGISSSRIQKELGVQKVARVMPNTPCLIGCGTCAVYFSGMTAAEQKIVREIFSAVASVYAVNSDDKIDAATAMIGSGPAYVFEIARIFSEKFSQMGFAKKTAKQIVKQVIKGSALLMNQSQDSPEKLRNQVTSKKGTTAAALQILQKSGLEKILGRALHAAYARAKTLPGK